MNSEQREEDAHPKADKGTPTEHNQNADVALPVPVLITNFPPTATYDERSYRNKQEAREKKKYRVEWATLIILFIYTSVAGYQAYLTRKAIRNSEDYFKKTLFQMQQQNTLARQQLVGTQAATIEVYPLQEFVAGINEAGVGFQNRGHVTGSVSGSLDVIRVRPDGTEVVLAHGDIPNSPVLLDRPLTKSYPFIGIKCGFTPSEWEHMADTRFLTPKQVFIVKGNYSYNDGFGDIYGNIPFCYSWLTHPEVTFITGTFRGVPQMTTEGAGANFQKCDMWNYQVNWIRNELRQPQNQRKAPN